MTQDVLAGAAGVSVRSVMRAEAGERLQMETLGAICAALRIDPADLPADPAEGPAKLSSPEIATSTDAPDGSDLAGVSRLLPRAASPWMSRAVTGVGVFLFLHVLIVTMAYHAGTKDGAAEARASLSREGTLVLSTPDRPSAVVAPWAMTTIRDLMKAEIVESAAETNRVRRDFTDEGWSGLRDWANADPAFRAARGVMTSIGLEVMDTPRVIGEGAMDGIYGWDVVFRARLKFSTLLMNGQDPSISHTEGDPVELAVRVTRRMTDPDRGPTVISVVRARSVAVADGRIPERAGAS